MSRENLKKMLMEDPNSFWQFLAIEGISEEIRSVIDEVDNEMDGSGVEISEGLALQIR